MKKTLLVLATLSAGIAVQAQSFEAIAEAAIQKYAAKLLTKDEIAPAALSTLQKAVDSCMLMTVVQDIHNGDGFVKIYGKCLTRNPDLKITEIRAAEGLAVTVKSEADTSTVEAYNGFLTVNVGKGPVKVMIVAYGAQVYLP